VPFSNLEKATCSSLGGVDPDDMIGTLDKKELGNGRLKLEIVVQHIDYFI